MSRSVGKTGEMKIETRNSTGTGKFRGKLSEGHGETRSGVYKKVYTPIPC